MTIRRDHIRDEKVSIKLNILSVLADVPDRRWRVSELNDATGIVAEKIYQSLYQLNKEGCVSKQSEVKNGAARSKFSPAFFTITAYGMEYAAIETLRLHPGFRGPRRWPRGEG